MGGPGPLKFPGSFYQRWGDYRGAVISQGGSPRPCAVNVSGGGGAGNSGGIGPTVSGPQGAGYRGSRKPGSGSAGSRPPGADSQRAGATDCTANRQQTASRSGNNKTPAPDSNQTRPHTNLNARKSKRARARRYCQEKARLRVKQSPEGWLEYRRKNRECGGNFLRGGGEKTGKRLPPVAGFLRHNGIER